MKYKNNPFNIRFSANSKWIGLCGNRNWFCEFIDIQFAVRVVMYLFLRTYRKRGAFTLGQCINLFCPKGDGDNNPVLYLSIIYNDTQLDESRQVASLTEEEWFMLLQSMARIETGYKLSFHEFYKGFQLFNVV